MNHPENVRGTKICIYVSKHGIKFYGNKQSFFALEKWMKRNAKSNPKDFYECHLRWDLTTHKSKIGKSPSNIWVLFDKYTAPVFKHLNNGKEDDFEVTFMTVPEKVLKEQIKYQKKGLAPDSWLPENNVEPKIKSKTKK